MKTSIYVFSLLSFILLLSSCKKEIVSKDIYGVWEMQKQTTTEGPQFTKLLLDKEDYNWIDPVVSDTIFFYKKIVHNASHQMWYSLLKELGRKRHPHLALWHLASCHSHYQIPFYSKSLSWHRPHFIRVFNGVRIHYVPLCLSHILKRNVDKMPALI